MCERGAERQVMTGQDRMDSLCANCGTPIGAGKAEVVMGARWKTWIVCRRCATSALRAGDLGS